MSTPKHSLSLTGELNAETIAVINDIENDENLIGPFSSVKELIESLDSPDDPEQKQTAFANNQLIK